MHKKRKSKKASTSNDATPDNIEECRETCPFWLPLVFRIFLFGILWWVLTDDAKSLLGIGAPITLVAAWTSVKLLAPLSISCAGFLYFTCYFVWSSVRGAIDVARCALHPQMPITPEFAEYKFHLPLESARVFMANSVSLIPGTLSTNLDKDWLYVHVLNKSATFEKELEKLEHSVARLFKIRLQRTNDDENG